MIEVRSLGGDQYEVKVSGKIETTQKVTLTEADRVRLAGEDVAAEKVIEESFRFLLEREPNTSILASFDLPIISRYFPEYEREIRRRLA
jgi:hypothetical protein